MAQFSDGSEEGRITERVREQKRETVREWESESKNHSLSINTECCAE